MNKLIVVVVIFFLLFSSLAQNNSKTFDFELYKNGEIISSKKLKIQLVKNLDTINCEILNNKIIIPEIEGLFTIFGRIKKKIIIIDNVDFSKLDPYGKFIFGIENNIDIFEPVSKGFLNFYILKNTTYSLKIENLEQAKKINFIIFSYEVFSENNRKEVKCYSRYSVTKK